MSARTKARKRALDVLYEAEMRGSDPVETVGVRLAQADPPVPEYAVELVEGVTAHRARIDELLSTYSVGWTLERMPPVDRGLLRIGVYELLWRDDVPDAVVIDEAVELATSLSTDESPGFVNGLLGRVLSLKPSLRVDAAAGASADVDRPAGLGVEDPPADQLLGEVAGGPVVDDGE